LFDGPVSQTIGSEEFSHELSELDVALS